MTLSLLLAASALFSAPLLSSDPYGVYAIVDEVVYEPDASKPERIQVHGVFSVARGIGLGDYYQAPIRGILYFRLTKEREAECLKHWTDLKRVAATGQAVAFGSRWEGTTPSVRQLGSVPKDPDPYPAEMEMQRVTPANPQVQLLRGLPRPVLPAAGEQVEAGALTLVARAGVDGTQGARLVFSVEDASGAVLSSPPITVEGDALEARWSPPMAFFPGESYTWRVQVSGEAGAVEVPRIRIGEKGSIVPVATSSFKVKAQPVPRWAGVERSSGR